MVRIHRVEPRQGCEVAIEFTDGTCEVVDLEPFLRGTMFEPMRADHDLFAAVAVDPELGTLVWPNGADLCPDVLYMLATGQSVEEFLGRASIPA